MTSSTAQAPVPALSRTVAALAVTALLTWSAARVPQPYLLAWYGWS